MTILSPETITTLKATIPFLQENGNALTEHFYKRLFNARPEVKEYFNTANQQKGAQQKALGGAICAFAQNLETPEMLESAISRISNKHASLNIKPEHYPIVGEHLLESINDLLDPAPPEILKAWEDAYNFLATVLIGKEEKIYSAQKEQEGGWNGFRKMEVFKREHESKWITSFYLRPSDPCPIIPFKPGQYLTLRIPTPDGSTTMRNYSLSGSPSWDHYRISVKREVPHRADMPEGYVSSYLHTQVSTGDILEIGPPCGDFILNEHCPRTPILFIAGGVGITPIIPMLHSLGANPATFIHASIDGENHALRNEVNVISSSNENLNTHFRYSSPSSEDIRDENHHSRGMITEEFLKDHLTTDTVVYFCGPKPMMLSIYKILQKLGQPASQIHFEFFGPQEEIEG